MNKISRREVIPGIITMGATVLSLNEKSFAQADSPIRVFRGEHQPKPLPFDATKLKGLKDFRKNLSNRIGKTITAVRLAR